ncbi:MAG TPA: MOSC domain-containing protein [Herbaspirillum sp.]|jgi:hypothetical protein
MLRDQEGATQPDASVTPAARATGVIVGLHRTPRGMLPMKSFPELRLIMGKGVEGDRYSTGEGYLTEKLAGLGTTDQRQVTLFEDEALQMLFNEHGVSMTMEEHRRNITTRGISLPSLAGKYFRIGEATLEGFATTPCKHIEEMIGKRIVPLMMLSPGLNARIILPGMVRVGDTIHIL